MAKRFKLTKLKIPSFQLCRSKSLSTFPGNPVPAIYRLSPANPKSLDILYPNQPDPPPSSIPCNHLVPLTNSPGSDRGKKLETAGGGRRSNFVIDQQEESESLISCLTNFSDEFYHEIVHSPGTGSYKLEKDIDISSHRSSSKKVLRAEHDRGGTISITRRRAEGKVKESFAVVKRSKDPYEDFKKSMLEMITEMEMFEAEELEQLLQCFLTLNSRQYHEVIARAFMEIWQELFCEPRL